MDLPYEFQIGDSGNIADYNEIYEYVVLSRGCGAWGNSY